MPAHRARNSKYTTCGKDCQIELRKFRRHQLWLKHCPSCLHPSTPEQREDFKRWQTERGTRKGDKAAGRPAKKREKELAGMLSEARLFLVNTLQAEREAYTDSDLESRHPQQEARISEIGSLLEKIRKTLDVTGTN
jgi:hypothetical protein